MNIPPESMPCNQLVLIERSLTKNVRVVIEATVALPIDADLTQTYIRSGLSVYEGDEMLIDTPCLDDVVVTFKTSGELRSIGERNYGAWQRFDYYECVDCKTQYPRPLSADRPSCNGHLITKCPWCRPDSEPGKHGRGL